MVPSSAELTYFSEVANTLNLSRAAQKLGISQPSLSLAIKRLEETVGTHLFVRHKQGVTLTTAGKKLLAHVNQLLHYWENTKSITQISHQEIQGRIVVGCNSTIALSLHRFIPQLLENNPKLDVKLQHDFSMKITNQVINSKIDIGLVIEPISHPALIVRKVAIGEMAFWTNRGSLTIQDIYSNQSVIICDPDMPLTQLLLKKCKVGNSTTRRFLTSSSLEVIANLTAMGCGIGILSSCIASSLYANKLFRVANTPVINYGIYLIYRKENRAVATVKAVVEAIKKCL
jgi:DNA-binding transcriptional LysR family regulator